MAISVDVVHASDGGPELVLACPRGGKSRVLSTVRTLPFVRDDHVRNMRRVFQGIIDAIHRTRFNGLDLGVNRDHGIAKPVNLSLGLAFGWLDHERTGLGP